VPSHHKVAVTNFVILKTPQMYLLLNEFGNERLKLGPTRSISDYDEKLIITRLIAAGRTFPGLGDL